MRLARPRVGVIGAGVFGATCALRLARHCQVTVFEREDDILGGASWGNQNRHHFGYHYPRSDETVRQCRRSHPSFEAFYGHALVWDMAAYYGVAREGSRTEPEEYLKFCERHGLPYRLEYPDQDQLRRSTVSLCLRVPEPVFDYWDLKRIIRARLADDPNVELRLGHIAVGGHIAADGCKRVEVRHPGGTGVHYFDALVNATFYEINTVCGWFGFRRRDFQYDTKELVIVRLPTARRVAITIMDGPFCTFLPMGRSDRFILGHVRESVLTRDVAQATPDRRPGDLARSRWPVIRDASAEFFPFVRRAEFVESIFTGVVVDPEALDDDARVSEITEHAHGCWTVFSAKIVSCVSVADELMERVNAYLGSPRSDAGVTR
jgi:FAD dependent oxidoreductase